MTVPDPAPADSPAADPRIAAATARYWRHNRRIVVALLCLWAGCGLGGVWLADWLNQWHVGGAPLGFWCAQQGSIVAFVLLVLAYAVLTARLDRRHRKELEELRR